MTRPRLSIIYSTHQEARNELFLAALERDSSFPEVESICIDGDSSDSTIAVAEQLGARVLQGSSTNRAARYNLGMSEARGDLILLHHPRCYVSTAGIQRLLAMPAAGQWGGFRHVFDDPSWPFRLTSLYSNEIRGRLQGIVYFDHCLFVCATLASKIRIPEVEIFEDTEYSYRLRKRSSPVMLDEPCWVSSVRFKRAGFARQALLNQGLKAAFHLGCPPSVMNRIYERGQNLNRHFRQ